MKEDESSKKNSDWATHCTGAHMQTGRGSPFISSCARVVGGSQVRVHCMFARSSGAGVRWVGFLRPQEASRHVLDPGGLK